MGEHPLLDLDRTSHGISGDETRDLIVGLMLARMACEKARDHQAAATCGIQIETIRYCMGIGTPADNARNALEHTQSLGYDARNLTPDGTKTPAE